MSTFVKNSNRVPAEYERRFLQALVDEEQKTLDSLREQHVRRQDECNKHKRMVQVSKNAADATRSLKQCAESINERASIFQQTYQKGLLANQCQETVSIMPTTDKFLDDWQVAIEALVVVSNLFEERIKDAERRITEAEGHQQAYQSLTDHLQKSISRLSANCEDLSATIEQKCLGLLHPLRRLPSEVLSLIFEQAVNDEYYTLKGQLHENIVLEDHFPRVAFRIASVSRRWRQVALECPRLWKYICAPVITVPRNISSFHHFGGFGVNPPFRHFGGFGANPSARNIIGRHQWDRSTVLVRDTPIEVTILGEEEVPAWNSLFTQRDQRWDRVNIIALHHIPSSLPSPQHLSIGSKVAVEIPSSVLSSTKTITCLGHLPTFTQPVTSLTTLCLSLPPRGPWPELALLLTNFFPALNVLELRGPVQSSSEHYSPRTNVRTHKSLRRLCISPPLLPYIGNEMNGGIIIPSLTHFDVTGIDSSFRPSNFALMLEASGISLVVTVTTLRLVSQVKSEQAAAIDTVSAFIQIFKVLSVIELEGTMIGTGINALLNLQNIRPLSKVIVNVANSESAKIQEDLQRLRAHAPHLDIIGSNGLCSVSHA